jgi:CRISPR-associated protein Cas2
MSRSRYIVCYDIADAKRLRRVFRTMRGFGDALQYSVFSCDLSAKERVRLEAALLQVMNGEEDRVLILDAGPSEGRGEACFRVLGRQDLPQSRQAVIV